MPVTETYQQKRAKELGFRQQGIGKRYGIQDLISFYESVTPEALRAQAFAYFIREYHTAPKPNDGRQKLYVSNPEERAITEFWAEATERDEVTTPEKFFYLGMDIVRLREGKGAFQAYMDSKGRVSQELQDPHNPDTTYTLRPDFPIFVSFVDYLNITIKNPSLAKDVKYTATRALHTMRGEEADFEMTTPTILPISVDEAQALLNTNSPFVEDKRKLGKRLGIHYPVVDFRTGESGFKAFIPTKFTPDELNTFGKSLWRAHQATPVKAA